MSKALPHNLTRGSKGTRFHWPWCRCCSLVLLNNEAYRKLANKNYPDREEYNDERHHG